MGLWLDEEKYLEASKRTADYFLEKEKLSNYKVVTDFTAPSEVGYFDNSAGVCAACGMIELYKITKSEKYLDGAVKILIAMEEDLIFDDSNQSIVQKCMGSYGLGVIADKMGWMYVFFALIGFCVLTFVAWWIYWLVKCSEKSME